MATRKRKANGNEGKSTCKRVHTAPFRFLDLPKGTVFEKTSWCLLTSVPELRDLIYASCQDTVYLRRQKTGCRKRRGIPGWLSLRHTCAEIRREFCLLGPFHVSSLDAQELVEVFLLTKRHLETKTILIVDIPLGECYQELSFNTVHSIMSQYGHLSMHLVGSEGAPVAIKLSDQLQETQLNSFFRGLTFRKSGMMCLSWE
jgi:hypothetical protein